MQKAVLGPSARIILAERKEDPSTMQTAFAGEILVLETEKTNTAAEISANGNFWKFLHVN